MSCDLILRRPTVRNVTKFYFVRDLIENECLFNTAVIVFHKNALLKIFITEVTGSSD